jgi:hypothetical protein
VGDLGETKTKRQFNDESSKHSAITANWRDEEVAIGENWDMQSCRAESVYEEMTIM